MPSTTGLKLQRNNTLHTGAYESPCTEHHPFSVGQRYIVTFSTHDQQQCSYCTSTCTSEEDMVGGEQKKSEIQSKNVSLRE